MPDEAINILVASLADSTIKQYSGPIKQWLLFCSTSGIDPYEANERHALTWFTQRYSAGASYGTLNSCRAALGLLAGESLSQSPMITRFFKGVFRMRPTKPRYDDTWDVAPVLEQISTLFPLESLTLPQMTDRLVMLLALATAHRMQTLAAIKVSNIVKTDRGYEIRIDSLIKTSRPGACQPLLLLPRFTEKPELCLASTLEAYLVMTKDLRGHLEELLITTRKPYKPATTQSIARWIKAFLARSGVNKKYKAHSTRHAVTSAALKRGIDINMIKNTAGWSKESLVFAKFYNRPIVDDRNNFAESVLL